MDEYKAQVCALSREEHFSLRVYTLDASRDAGPTLVPVVDGWVQLDVPIVRVPDPAEAREYFAHIAALIAALRAEGLLARWTYVHKAPGLRLRFAAPGEDASVTARLIGALQAATRRQWAWALPPSFASYFEQRELFSGLGDDATAILCRSADLRIAAAIAGHGSDVPGWAAFTVAFLHHFLPDTWWVWEALGRFQRLRGDAGGNDETVGPLDDPRPLLAALPPAPRPDFAVSVALLTCLNYLYNQWALGPAAQRAVLRLARALTQPEPATP